jgi:hypothetical protein
MGQQIQFNKQTEVVLKLVEGKKKSKSQMNWLNYNDLNLNRKVVCIT